MILAAWVLIAAVITCMIVPKWVRLMDDVPEEYDQCHDCTCGWCDAAPGDDECRKWRAENEQGLQSSEKNGD